MTGLTAVYLAEAGHTGPRNILDSARHCVFRNDISLGEDEHISTTYFKPYACCRHIHAPLAALEMLMTQNLILGRDIDRIEVKTHAAGLRISNRPQPENLINVQYSIPFYLTLFSLCGPQSLVPVTPDVIGRADVVELASKVDLSLNAELDAVYPAEILSRVIVTARGEHFVYDPTPPRGEPLMTWEELETKFRMATRLAMTPAEAEAMIGAVVSMRAGDPSPL